MKYSTAMIFLPVFQLMKRLNLLSGMAATSRLHSLTVCSLQFYQMQMRNKNKVFIGIDTSCYTTSVAAVDECGSIISDRRRILSVPKGENGLRQSDGLFQHVRQLPDLYRQLLFDCRSKYGNEPFEIKEVAVSSKPRSNQDSYMPVFLAGKAFAHVIADSFGCCCFETDHQWGHLMAAMHQKKFNPDRTLYAIHLSGGTTEMLKVDRQMHSDDIFGATIDSST